MSWFFNRYGYSTLKQESVFKCKVLMRWNSFACPQPLSTYVDLQFNWQSVFQALQPSDTIRMKSIMLLSDEHGMLKGKLHTIIGRRSIPDVDKGFETIVLYCRLLEIVSLTILPCTKPSLRVRLRSRTLGGIHSMYCWAYMLLGQCSTLLF